MPKTKRRMKTFHLTVKVCQSWIDDGFDFDEDRIAWLQENLIEWAHEGEVVVSVAGIPEEQYPDKMVKVYTVVPRDYKMTTIHCYTKEEATTLASQFRDGADVIDNEVPERIVERKRQQVAMYGYRLR